MKTYSPEERSCYSGQIFPCGLLLVLCFALSGAAVAQTQYYVAKDGSDSNDGSRVHPWATINHADQAVVLGTNGTVVHVGPGTYSGQIVTHNGGTASRRITYISDSPYGAKLGGATSGAGYIWLNWAPYIDIIGFEFDGSINKNNDGGFATELPEAHHVHFLNNKIHDVAYYGGRHNTGGDAIATMFHGVSPTQAIENLYEGNVIYHNNGGAGTHQTSYGDSGGGMTVGWGDVVRNNIIMDQGGGWCAQITHTSNAVTFTNNTLLNCDRGGIIIGNPGSYQGGIDDYTTITNNIVVNSGFNGGSSGIRLYGGSSSCGPHNVYANNLLYGNSPSNYQFDKGCSNTATGTQTGSNSTTFAGYTGTISGDYHLKSGSTAIDTGTTACALSNCVPRNDVASTSRPQGKAYDISAYEFTLTDTAGTPTPPKGLAASVH